MEYLQEANGFNQVILRRQYGYFKDKPGKDLVETRVKLMTLKPDADTLKSSHEQDSWDSLNAPDDISTEKYLGYYLGDTLRSAPLDEFLQIWYGLIHLSCNSTDLSNAQLSDFGRRNNAASTLYLAQCDRDIPGLSEESKSSTCSDHRAIYRVSLGLTKR